MRLMQNSIPICVCIHFNNIFNCYNLFLFVTFRNKTVKFIISGKVFGISTVKMVTYTSTAFVI